MLGEQARADPCVPTSLSGAQGRHGHCHLRFLSSGVAEAGARCPSPGVPGGAPVCGVVAGPLALTRAGPAEGGPGGSVTEPLVPR